MPFNKMTQNTDEETFEQLFSKNIIYEIPLFQRNYKWANDLMDGVEEDFDDIIGNNTEIHFFGSVILYPIENRVTEAKRFEVIDGQQRLTTMFLFILACTYEMRRWSLEDAKKLYKTYLVNNQENAGSSTVRPNINDRAQLNGIFKNIITKPFEEILLEGSYQKIPCDPNSREDGKLRSNYNKFKRYLNRKLKDTPDTEKIEKIYEFLEKVLKACRVVSLRIYERHHGPLIFDKLNANPVSMKIHELVKNAIFERIAKQPPEIIVQFHAAYWKPFEKNFSEGETGMENYFFPFALILDSNAKKNEAYKVITSDWKEKEKKLRENNPKAALSTESIIEDLSEYQKGYNALTTGRSEYPSNVQKAIDRIYRAKLPSTSLSFLLRLMKRIETQESFIPEALKIFNALETFFVRRSVCGFEGTGLHAVFKRMWGALEEIGELNSENIIKYIKGLPTVAVIDNLQFEEKLKTEPMYGKGISRFMIEEYDKYVHGESPEFNKETEIEHVLPQNINNFGDFPDFTPEQHEQFKDVYANLIPMSAGFNKDLSNKPFKTKQKLINKNSMFASTRELFEKHDEWTPEIIKKRGEMLAKWALIRWDY